MKAYRAKARVIAACRATIGNVVETPPEDGPGDTGDCDRPAVLTASDASI